MKDKYVGDIGDFGQCGLLRAICGTPEKRIAGLTLGVVWYYSKIEPPTTWKPVDTDEKFTFLDEPLFRKFRDLIENNRTIAGLQSADILPTELYFDIPVSGLSRKERKEWWIKAALHRVDAANIVYFSPDNGIATKAMTDKDANKKSPHTKRSDEHIFIDELKEFICAGKSLIIYQHLDSRNYPSPKIQIQLLAERLRKEGAISNEIRIFWWHSRFFIVIVQRGHTLLTDTLDKFQESNWCKSGHLTEETHWLGNLAN